MTNTRALIVVSSASGNTWKVGQALKDAYPESRLEKTETVLADPSLLDAYDTVFVGFWCDRGVLPEPTARLAERLKNKTLGLFATMGGYPTTDSAREWMQEQARLVAGVDRGNTVHVRFLCQGRIDPSVLERMKSLPGYTETPESTARRQEAAKHPNDEDFDRVVSAFKARFD